MFSKKGMVWIEWGSVSKGIGFVYWKIGFCRKGLIFGVINRTLRVGAVLHWKVCWILCLFYMEVSIES